MFDINQCSSHPNPASLDSPKETAITSSSSSSRETITTAVAVIETLEDNIITNICNNIQEEVQKEQQLDDNRTNIVHKLVTTYTDNIDQQQHQHLQRQANYTNKSVLNLIISSSSSSDYIEEDRNDIIPVEVEEQEDQQQQFITSATPSTSSSPIGRTIEVAEEEHDNNSNNSGVIMPLCNLKTLVIAHILNILNNGSYEEVSILYS